MSRRRAVYSVFVYRGEDLPQTDLGVMASVQRAVSSKDVAFVDAFVQISFAGHTVRPFRLSKAYYNSINYPYKAANTMRFTTFVTNNYLIGMIEINQDK